MTLRKDVGRLRPETVVIATAVVVTAAIAVSTWSWLRDHPFPIYWDDAHYVNSVERDVVLLKGFGVVRVAKAFIFDDVVRPSAYRVLALPYAVVAGASTTALRIFAGGCTLLAILGVAYAAYLAGGVTVAARCFVLLLTLPPLAASFRWFGTEFPLYLAVALLLVAFASASRGVARGCWWPLLAGGLMLGLWSKTSFILIAGPAVVAFSISAVLLDHRRLYGAIAALMVAGAVALPWWYFNWKHALVFGKYASSGERWADGTTLSVGGAVARLGTAAQSLVGLPLLIALVAVCLSVEWKRLNKAQWHLIAIALATALPLLLVGLGSPVFVSRHMAPILLPLGFAVSLAWSAGHDAARLRSADRLLCGLALLQIILIAGVPFLAPDRIPALSGLREPFGRFPQFDWNVLRVRLRGAGLPEPRIAYLGYATLVSPPEIEHPWVSHGEKVTAEWLWRWDEGSIDWRRVLQRAAIADAVLIPLPLQQWGRAPDPSEQSSVVRDNQHNEVLAEWLEHHPGFRNEGMPIVLPGGVPIRLWVRRARTHTVDGAAQTSNQESSQPISLASHAPVPK